MIKANNRDDPFNLSRFINAQEGVYDHGSAAFGRSLLSKLSNSRDIRG